MLEDRINYTRRSLCAALLAWVSHPIFASEVFKKGQNRIMKSEKSPPASTSQVMPLVESITPRIFDERVCALGEGPLWHPERAELFWVDLLGKCLLSKGETDGNIWQLDEMPSAIAWVDTQTLLLACESGLNLFDISSGRKTLLCELESDLPNNRCNDGRADPWGGFWIGTMSKTGEIGQGALYRWYRGELRCIETGLTVPNGLCFDRNRECTYLADSAENMIYKYALDADSGWPLAPKSVFIDLRSLGLIPDGAIVDKHGNVWCAQWDAAQIACYSPGGELLSTLAAHTPRSTCPAFGGRDFTDLYLTTAAVGLDDVAVDGIPHGTTLVFQNAVEGVAEPAVVLHAQTSYV